MRAPPAYQCYGSDFIASETYKLATSAERGLLFSLYNYLWVNKTISADHVKIARLLELSPEDTKALSSDLIAEHIAPTPADAGRYCCPELDRQRAALEKRRELMSKGGHKGGTKTQARFKNSDDTPSIQPSSHHTSPPSKLAKGAEMSRNELNREEKSIASKKEDIEDDFVREMRAYENKELVSCQ